MHYFMTLIFIICLFNISVYADEILNSTIKELKKNNANDMHIFVSSYPFRDKYKSLDLEIFFLGSDALENLSALSRLKNSKEFYRLRIRGGKNLELPSLQDLPILSLTIEPINENLLGRLFLPDLLHDLSLGFSGNGMVNLAKIPKIPPTLKVILLSFKGIESIDLLPLTEKKFQTVENISFICSDNDVASEILFKNSSSKRLLLLNLKKIFLSGNIKNQELLFSGAKNLETLMIRDGIVDAKEIIENLPNLKKLILIRCKVLNLDYLKNFPEVNIQNN